MSRSRGDWKKIIIVVIAGILAIAAFGFGVHLIEKHGLEDVQFGDTGGWGNDEAEPTELAIGDDLYVSQDDVETYLLIGLDPGGTNKGEIYSGRLADFLTLMIVDNTTKKFGFIQLDRNSMVPMEIPDENGNFAMMATQQICLAHWYGRTDEERSENTKNAVSTLMGGMAIDSCYSLNMEDIGAVNHALGGVIVDIDEDLTDIDPAFKKGESILLTDEQAEKYVHARMGLNDETNASRMKRQRQYMQKAYNLVMNQLRENPEYINDVYQELDGKLVSDGNNRDYSQIANKMVIYESMGIMQLDGTTQIGDTQGDGREYEEFYVNESSIIKCLGKIMDITKASDDYYEKQDVAEDDEADVDSEEADADESADDDTGDAGEPFIGDPNVIQVEEQ